MSKAQRKTKTIRLVTAEDQQAIAAEDHRGITKDDVAQRAYELFLARGRVEGRDVEDWLEAERQLMGNLMSASHAPHPSSEPSTQPNRPPE